MDCIYEGERSLYIHPDECVDCGACEPVCPVEAIFYEDDTPEEWKEYYNANVDFFSDLGSPGGAAKMGLIPADHALVSALPPQADAIRLSCPAFSSTVIRAMSSSTNPGTRTLPAVCNSALAGLATQATTALVAAAGVWGVRVHAVRPAADAVRVARLIAG